MNRHGTHTFVTLEVPAGMHAFVKAKLLEAGYSHALYYGDDEPLDMQGIALTKGPPETPKCCSCGTTEGLHKDGWYGYRCDKDGCMVL